VDRREPSPEQTVFSSLASSGRLLVCGLSLYFSTDI
jgi:hypothetical protein